MQAISSRRHPIVRAYRDAARRRNPGELLLDGEHLIAEAETAGVAFRHVAVASPQFEREDDPAGRLARRLQRRGIPVDIVATSLLDALSPARAPSGLVALAERPATDVHALLHAPQALLAVAIDVQDPGNLGALVRAAEAAGGTGVVTCGQSADPFGWKALRGSMGSAFRLPIAAGLTASDLLARLRAHGIRTLAMVPAGGRSLYDAPLDRPLAVLLGSEGRGLDPASAAAADEAVTIPMQPPVESLNVAVAGALLLFEAARRRRERS